MAVKGKVARPRRYKEPVDRLQKMRAVRMINMVRASIIKAAIEEEDLAIDTSPQGQHEFVHRHRRLQKHLAGHFPFIDINQDAYASDISHALAKDITYYILHGDTPGQ